MLPAVLGWMLWTRAHAFPSPDSTITYYTDYLRYEFLNVDRGNIGVVVWKNLSEVLYGMGSLVLPKLLDFGPVKILTQVIAVAMIAGIVRLVRRGIAVEYAAFALVSTGMLLVWHFPPSERFVLPLCPLLLAGLWTEGSRLAGMLKTALRHRDAGQRVVARGFAAVVVAIFGIALALQFYVTFFYLQDSAEQKRPKMDELRRRLYLDRRQFAALRHLAFLRRSVDVSLHRPSRKLSAADAALVV